VIEGFMEELVERFEEGPIRDALAGALERRMAQVLD
jgi:Fe-S cluster assembly protein SufD